MQNGTLNLSESTGSDRQSRQTPPTDELGTVKRDLLRAEVRLAKARATAAGAEADVKVLNARLKALTK